jgi:hypothetical protein
MTVKWTHAVGLLVVAMAAAGPAHSQVGHPVKGSWSGYWGPSPDDRTRMLLVLDWENNEIVGTINPGPNAVPLERAELDLSTWTLTIEASMPVKSGGTARYVATGRLENLGSWINRRYSGTYQLGREDGTFSLTLN